MFKFKNIVAVKKFEFGKDFSVVFTFIYQTIRHITCPHEIMLWKSDLSKSKRVYKTPKFAMLG